jgi:hypothetical protein
MKAWVERLTDMIQDPEAAALAVRDALERWPNQAPEPHWPPEVRKDYEARFLRLTIPMQRIGKLIAARLEQRAAEGDL